MNPSSPMVVRPATTAEVAQALRSAGDGGVLVRGAGTKLHWGGSPAPVSTVVDLSGLVGVVAHEPGDLVATVRAGTPLRALQEALGAAGQRLCIDGASPGATVGGVLAAAQSGPLRLRHGTGRDLLIGVEFVRADGVVARAGGRVVKNVAGYDVGKLLCGSFGTLGALTAATFRLHPRPAAVAYVCAPVPADFGAAATAVLTSTLAPSALELDLPGETGTLVVLLEGSPAGVAERARAACRLLGDGAVVSEEPPPWWGTYPFTGEDVALRLAAPVSALPAAVAALRGDTPLWTEGRRPPVRGSAGAGVVHAALPATLEPERVAAILAGARAAVGAAGGSIVVVAAPAPLRDHLDLWGPVPGLALMRQLKARFDPDGRFVAGRYVGGI